MSRRGPRELNPFEILLKKIGEPISSRKLQAIFRETWDYNIENWLKLEKPKRDEVTRQIWELVPASVLPQDTEERVTFTIEVTRCINDAYYQSWSNMKHRRSSRLRKEAGDRQDEAAAKNDTGTEGEEEELRPSTSVAAGGL